MPWGCILHVFFRSSPLRQSVITKFQNFGRIKGEIAVADPCGSDAKAGDIRHQTARASIREAGKVQIEQPRELFTDWLIDHAFALHGAYSRRIRGSKNHGRSRRDADSWPYEMRQECRRTVRSDR